MEWTIVNSATDQPKSNRLFIALFITLVIIMISIFGIIGFVLIEQSTGNLGAAIGIAMPVVNVVAGPLQLIIILIILAWALDRFGIRFSSIEAKVEWNTQSILAMVIVVAFALAALGGMDRGATLLKDLALVVVGFYFGTQRKMIEIDPQTGKIRTVEEHSNDGRPSQTPAQSGPAMETPKGDT